MLIMLSGYKGIQDIALCIKHLDNARKHWDHSKLSVEEKYILLRIKTLLETFLKHSTKHYCTIPTEYDQVSLDKLQRSWYIVTAIPIDVARYLRRAMGSQGSAGVPA